MAGQVLKDNKGFKIGEITVDSSGKQVIRDARGFKCGEYDPKTNVTKDNRGFKVGTGNLLATLI